MIWEHNLMAYIANAFMGISMESTEFEVKNISLPP